MIKLSQVYVAEYISSIDRDKAYEFINMLLSALPIKKDEKVGSIESKNVKLNYNKTKLKKEANFYIEIDGEYYMAKYIHSKLNHYEECISNEITAFILSNEKEVENFIME
ncbi:hypothetical protein JYG23_12865 [Sedimentibacter sp. zth1]|uniref:hypothetical protein n=1 Tax=Sedimentibacter sp. zth1 TaxID=2816908 RepID=UPI001A91AE29|nr:hypothetical protein [Sedimentibacter sp. zth1]QSX05551.1 hypothetical protein JYG23_12865 [Sedimentibacter sp. zth1]